MKNNGNFPIDFFEIQSEQFFFSAQDQMIIQKLKERIAQLDVENSLLTKASIEHDDTNQTHDEENHYDLDTLLKRISKLKVLIRVANDRFGKSLSIEGQLKTRLSLLNNFPFLFE